MSKTNWQIDPAHSEVTFRVRHLMVSTVSGKFGSFSATASTTENDFSTADVEFTVDTASINTGVDYRDTHLQSDDFFNSEKFPQMRFVSTSITPAGENEFDLHGNLTIRDITKPVALHYL